MSGAVESGVTHLPDALSLPDRADTGTGGLAGLSPAHRPTLDREKALPVLLRAGFDSWTAAGVLNALDECLRPAPGVDRTKALKDAESALIEHRRQDVPKRTEMQVVVDAVLALIEAAS